MKTRDATRWKKTYSLYRQEPRTEEGSSCVICNTILNGEGEPANDLGLIDDLYINTENMDLYGPKGETGWGEPIPLSGGTSTNPGGLNSQVQFNDSDEFGGSASLTFNKITEVLSAKNISIDTDTLVTIGSKVGIGTATPNYELEVVGEFAATVKSFVVDHPNKPGWKLRHGTLEGPENGVYVRGKSKNRSVQLPDYWENFVDEETITVHITPFGNPNIIYVTSVSIKEFTVDSQSNDIEYYYNVQAKRKDRTFEVEYTNN